MLGKTSAATGCDCVSGITSWVSFSSETDLYLPNPNPNPRSEWNTPNQKGLPICSYPVVAPALAPPKTSQPKAPRYVRGRLTVMAKSLGLLLLLAPGTKIGKISIIPHPKPLKHDSMPRRSKKYHSVTKTTGRGVRPESKPWELTQKPSTHWKNQPFFY